MVTNARLYTLRKYGPWRSYGFESAVAQPMSCLIHWMCLRCGPSACRLGEHDHSNHGEQKVEHERRDVLETYVDAQKEDVGAKGE